ncbi:Uncharacterised protein [Salmonella enterica subsp. arizonae]|nr:Uncharacterised protein [Salmonella enterica subsp. arizonae]
MREKTRDLRTFRKRLKRQGKYKGAADAAPGKGSVFARFTELNIRITFLGQVQVNHRWGNIGEVVAAIQRQLRFILTLKFFEFLRIGTFNPARRRHVDGFINRLNVVFALQARDNNIKLQNAYGADNQIVVGNRTEYLNRAFFR